METTGSCWNISHLILVVIKDVTFNVSGSFTYDCSIGNHAANGMVATISVVEYFEANLIQFQLVIVVIDAGSNVWPYILEASNISDGDLPTELRPLQ